MLEAAKICITQDEVATGVFTTQVKPSYDDVREEYYHFPEIYLGEARKTIGDWILYYEPRREHAGSTRATGRQAYIAMAFVVRIERDPKDPTSYYAFLKDYTEFPSPVPFKEGQRYFESGLKKEDGSTNKGRFGRSVRSLPFTEFQTISELGMARAIEDAEEDEKVAETQADYAGERRKAPTSRTVRDAAFARIVTEAYDRTCAMTGLRMINLKRAEVEAAHIRPVEHEGPDSPRNGIALSRTIHWMFDRHWLAIGDEGEILVADRLVPQAVQAILNPNLRITRLDNPNLSPHPVFVRFHRKGFTK